ncbi:CBS domain-containing protein [Candidatus Undinarchaeota archaeon]
MQRRIRESLKKGFNRRKVSDYGPVDFETHKADRPSQVLPIATKKVVSVTKTTPIKKATELMLDVGVRRMPVVDPGTQRVVGILTSTDVMDFLGGGEKANIVNNINQALNYPVGKLMAEKVKTLNEKATIQEAINVFLSVGVGGLPIINKKNELQGILTIRDLMHTVSGKEIGIKVEDMMSEPVIATPNMSIPDVTKVMVKNNFFRLPVIENNTVIGMITSMDLVRAVANSEIFSQNVLVKDIMTKRVTAARPDTDLGQIAEIIYEKGTGAFPVISNGKLVGIITEYDVLRGVSKK